MRSLNRKQFLKLLGAGGLLFSSFSLMAKKEKPEAKVLANVMLGMVPTAVESSVQDGEKMDTQLVKEFVSAGHGRVETVKELFATHPTLINVAHDWGNGDFETCLGAASHVGHLELASWLVDRGAQVNIFTAALFGKMEIVKPMLEFFPAALNARGPHGFTLLHHAVKGGEKAEEVRKYLEDLGAKEMKLD